MRRCGDCRYFDFFAPVLQDDGSRFRYFAMDRDSGRCLYFQKKAMLTPLWAKPAGKEVWVLYGKECPVFEDKLDTPEFPGEPSVPTREERDLDTEYRLTVLEEQVEYLRELVTPVR